MLLLSSCLCRRSLVPLASFMIMVFDVMSKRRATTRSANAKHRLFLNGIPMMHDTYYILYGFYSSRECKKYRIELYHITRLYISKTRLRLLYGLTAQECGKFNHKNILNCI